MNGSYPPFGRLGAIGRLTAAALRSVHPEVPLLIGGRDLAKDRKVADEIGGAEGVAIDGSADDLGLGDRRVSTVAVFYLDERLAGLRYARERRVPHLRISSGGFEIAPEIAAFMHWPEAAAMVLGYEWLVGATTVASSDAPGPSPGSTGSPSARWSTNRTAVGRRSPRISNA